MKTPVGQIGPDYQFGIMQVATGPAQLKRSKMTPFDWQPALQPAELRDSLR